MARTRFVLAVVFAAVGGLSLAAADYKAPRTSWGEPDFQGVWSSAAEQTVPFERNAQYNVETADTANAGAVGSATSPPPHWLERSETSRRTSSVIDPPNGRVPEMTDEGRQRALRAIPALGNGPFDGPEQMSTWVRCI